MSLIASPTTMLRAFTAALLGMCLVASAGAANGQGPSCAWGPVTDVQAARARLDDWAVATHLPPFNKDASDLSIDRSSVRLMLQFPKGTLTLSWALDAECQPTAVTIQAAPDYEGIPPGEDAVKQLVESLRSVTVEQRSGPRSFFALRLKLLVVGVVLAALVWLVRRLGTRLTGLVPRALARLRGVPASGWVRLIGVFVIVVLLPYETPQSVFGNSRYAYPSFLIGILALMTFLWLAVSGYFGYGSPSREDWPALVVFLLALGIREGYARHAIEEIEIHFFYGGFLNRHSVVYPLLEMFLQRLARDPYLFMMHVNGILGALATLPLYLFVRQRTNSRMAAGLVATFFAVHPIIVQMAPTDGHYSMVFFTWFSGLALLTAKDIGARQLFGGAALLGIAATCRAEGTLYMAASLLLIDVRALLGAVRRHVAAATLSGCAVLGLVAVHVYFCFPVHIPQGQHLPNIGTFTLSDVFRAGLVSDDYNDRIFVELVAVGALAGLVNRRLRIGLGAALGTLVVVWPVSMTTTGGFTILHRMVPVCALQAIAAGVGAAWITSWLPARIRHHWATAIPALTVALYLFVMHRHEVRDPNAVTDEFWMLRNHLAPGGAVNTECTLLSVGRLMDTDIHNFSQVLPGMTTAHCEQEDCVRRVSDAGCFYYLRSLNCYFAEVETPPECQDRGRTPAGDLFACIDPECARLEHALERSPVEERTVDMYALFHGLAEQPQWPRTADIGLYRVLGVRKAAANGDE